MKVFFKTYYTHYKFINKNAIFPRNWKIAEIHPIFKKGSKFDINNYRPISVLPNLSKLMEKTIHIQLTKFLTKNNLLYRYQSGFRQTYSTQTACIILLNDIYKNIEKKHYICLLVLDLSKAFDLINHDILINKLQYQFNFSTHTLKLFKTYLRNRKQCVNIKQNLSNILIINSGVPQGSIHGRLLFNLYINDLNKFITTGKPYIYADDTVIIIKSKQRVKLLNKIKCTLKDLSDYCINNGLTINVKKTNLTFINNINNHPLLINELFYINNIEVLIDSSFKYLGYHLDNKLTFKEHNLHLINKLSTVSSILTYCSKQLPKNIYS
jgi:hypothetical protein